MKKAYSEPRQASKMDIFLKIISSWKPSTILAKSSNLDFWQGSE